MQNGIFRDSECGFYSTNADSTFCSNLLCENITNEYFFNFLYKLKGTLKQFTLIHNAVTIIFLFNGKGDLINKK